MGWDAQVDLSFPWAPISFCSLCWEWHSYLSTYPVLSWSRWSGVGYWWSLVSTLSLQALRITRLRINLNKTYRKHQSHLMTKPTKWLCTQRRLRLAWASTESGQSLHCALNGKLRAQGFFKRKTGQMPRLIRVFAGCTCHFVAFVMRCLITRIVLGTTKPNKMICALSKVSNQPVHLCNLIRVLTVLCMKKLWVLGYP